MSGAVAERGRATELRARCHGLPPLTARLAGWQLAVLGAPDRLAGWLDRFGSPLNLIGAGPFAANAVELSAAAARHRVPLRIFFARKANKCLTFVDAAARLGMGVDVASEPELRQALDRGLAGADLIVTAAVKPARLLGLARRSGATVALDNRDEVLALCATAAGPDDTQTPVALRLGNLAGVPSRFGIDAADVQKLVAEMWSGGGPAVDRLRIEGLHFHLDGYAAGDRVAALAPALAIADDLRAGGHPIAWVDIGGGIPMSYLDSGEEWAAFWRAHRAGLLGAGPRTTLGGQGLGLAAHDGRITGAPRVYPNHQRPVRGEWLDAVLGAEIAIGGRRETIAGALRRRGLGLRVEPGRALLDGCGLTAARVEFRKPGPDGDRLIGLDMNRTQCRSAADDHPVDPLVIGVGGARTGPPLTGHLVGAYCIEREYLTWRRLRFPHGVGVGDIVVFPNTAGYFMHIMESRAHQMPLARNLVIGADPDAPRLDPIDR